MIGGLDAVRPHLRTIQCAGMLDANVNSREASLPAKHVEDVSCCVVREYLSRKGLKSTLAKMDEELPRSEGCFSARDQLIRAVCAERVVRENKERNTPYKAILEMLIEERLLKKLSKLKQGSASKFVGIREVNNNDTSFAKNVYGSGSNESLTSTDTIVRNTDPSESRRPLSARGRRDPGGFVARERNIEAIHKLILKSQQHRDAVHQEPDPHFYRLEEPFVSLDGQGDKGDATDALGKKMGEVLATHVQRSKALRRNILSARYAAPPSVMKTVEDAKVPSVHLPRPARTITMNLDNVAAASLSVTREGSEDITKSFLLRSQSAPRLETSARHSSGTADVVRSNLEGLTTKTKGSNGVVRTTCSMEDVEVSEVTDQDICIDRAILSYRSVNFRPITLEEATEIKNLLFGTSSAKFGEEWAQQGFTFINSNAVRYGLLQKKGGPCGVLAVVQAYLLKELLWPDPTQDGCTKSTDVDDAQRNAALAKALAFILWQASNGRKAIIVNPSGVKVLDVQGLLPADGITETLTVSTFTSRQAVLDYYNSCISKEENCSSCVAFLISVVMTHGIDRIREEMDESNSCFIGKHSHCNQEMVNLLLVGRAVTNVFNDEVSFGKEEKTVLRGIKAPSNIGLLSLYEHYNSCEVGSHYKDPKFPIWLVLSESHFSVLFSKTRAALSPSGQQFELYYYDGLNKQEEEIKLSIDPSVNITCEDSIMTPPLELCIRTRWKGAFVSWNKSEPLL